MLDIVRYFKKPVPDCISAMWTDVVRNTGDANTPEEYEACRLMRGLGWDNFNSKGTSAAMKSSFFASTLQDPPPLEDDPNAAFSMKRFPHHD